MDYPSDYGADFDCVVTVISPAGTQTIERGTQLSIRLSESNPASWVLSIIDEDGTYCPDRKLLANGSPNPWYGVLTQQAFNWSDGLTYARYMTAWVAHGGQSLRFVGVPTSRGHSARWPDGKVRTTWSGVDRSHILFRENQSMDAVRSNTGAGTTYSVAAMREVCEMYLLGFNAGNVPTNIPVPVQQRMREKPIKWITDLLSVPVGEWYCDADGVIHVYIPDTTTVADTFDLANDWITEVDDEYSEIGFAFNRIVATRATEVASIIQGTAQQVATYQQYTVTFPQAVANLKWEFVYAFNGVFSDFQGYLGGNLVASCQRRIGAVGGAGTTTDVIDYSSTGSWGLVDEVRFTWGPPVTFSTTQAQTVARASASYGLIRFRGADPFMQSFGEQTLWEWSDPPQPEAGASQGISVTPGVGGYVVTINGHVVGTVQNEMDAHNLAGSLVGDHPRILEGNPLIPNDEWLKLNAQRWRRRFMRDSVRTRLKMPLRLDVRPGQSYRYVNPRLGIDRTMYVTDVEHSISRDWGQRYTSVSLVEYPVY